MKKQKILIVEDELEIADVLATYLQAAGYETYVLDNGDAVLDWVKSRQPALIILDIYLPGTDGLSLCGQIREFSQVPIIMATAKIQEVDRILGLETGADDYVCKPYSAKEVVARVKANLRRFRQLPEQAEHLVLDSETFCLSYQNQAVDLTNIEFALLKLLYSNPSRIYSRTQIIDQVYQDYREVSDRTVDSHIRNLRKKLNQLPLENELIRSIYGAGYKFEPL